MVACNICSYDFKYKYNLTKHLKQGYFYKALDECHLDFKEG